ncbi:unnamed protein product, partial [Allacma fusca]
MIRTSDQYFDRNHTSIGPLVCW